MKRGIKKNRGLEGRLLGEDEANRERQLFLKEQRKPFRQVKLPRWSWSVEAQSYGQNVRV